MSSSNSSSHPYPPTDPLSGEQLTQMQQQAIRSQYAHQQQSNQRLLIQAATSALASSPTSFMNSNNSNAGNSNSGGLPAFPQLSAATEEILKRVGAAGNQPGWEAAKQQVLQSMVTTQNMPTPPPIQSTRRRSTAPRPSLGASGSPPTARGGRGGGRGGRGGKRKRGVVKQESDESDLNSSGSDSGAAFTMDGTKTKSGRKVHRPTHYDPAAKTPTRRRGPYRRMHEATVCRICQRGHSPASNMIVYCDGCNTPYHQLCHDPVISEEVVRVEEKEWICAGCNAVKEGRSKAGMSGEGYNPEDKRTYLLSLPPQTLVDLLLYAESLHPSLPIYPPGLKTSLTGVTPNPTPTTATATSINAHPSITPHNFISTTHPDNLATSTITLHHPSTQQTGNPLHHQDPLSATTPHIPDEYINFHYPKAGHGIRLPPEAEDMAWLVDDDFLAFSHIYRDLPPIGGDAGHSHVEMGGLGGGGGGEGVVDVGA
ncbi:hypothetical protein FGG08_006545 [Glutinoglossum americanum]|uniref:PHD-type domain-containing protein n=1 Tax=Glutinoglossum americanum TaxID=1670608 RepID=A0A9P8HW32_9PEZI|nr:hypothetical protein FGG08_006545 [Glutinoglossum americanum]